VLDLFVEAGLASSKSEARRLVQQGGASVNGVKVEGEAAVFATKDFSDGALFLRAGKKRVCRVILE